MSAFRSKYTATRIVVGIMPTPRVWQGYYNQVNHRVVPERDHDLVRFGSNFIGSAYGYWPLFVPRLESVGKDLRLSDRGHTAHQRRMLIIPP